MSDDVFEAIERHDLDLLARLLTAGGDPNELRSGTPTWRPLHAAVEEIEHGGPVDAVVILLRHGAGPDAWDGNRAATPLLMACFRSQREAVRMFLVAGADPDVVGDEGDSPLRWWIEAGDHDMVRLLLDCGADATVETAGGFSGTTPLGLAATRLDVRMIQLLLAHGANTGTRDLDRRLALERLPARTSAVADRWDAAAALLKPAAP
jgi:ankyrin repeat protein